MPEHVRKQIRDAVVDLLDGLTVTGDRVFIGRTRPLQAGHAPTILVYARDEAIERETMGRPPALARTCTLIVECRMCSATPPDDALDAIAADVEAAIGDDPRIGGIAIDSVLQRTEIEAVAQGEWHLGAARLTYAVRYRTPQNDATQIV